MKAITSLSNILRISICFSFKSLNPSKQNKRKPVQIRFFNFSVQIFDRECYKLALEQ